LKTSFRLFTLFGIEVQLHFTFLFLLFLMALLGLTPLIFFIVLFASVIAHEFSHSIVAKYRGLEVSRIILTPIGGIAFTEDITTDAKTELMVSFAGPGFNFLVVAVVWMWGVFSGNTQLLISSLTAGEIPESIFGMIFYSNFVLGVFNFFMPALPLDGGRFWRSLLALKIGYLRATRVLINVSMMVAFLMFLAGVLLPSFWLMLIAVFIYFFASIEYQTILLQNCLSSSTVKDVMQEHFLEFDEDVLFERAVNELHEKRMYFAVIKKGSEFFVFDVNNFEVLDDTVELWQAKIIDFSVPVEPLSPDESAMDVFKKMAKQGLNVVPVQSRGKVLGIVTRESLSLELKFKRILNAENE